MPTPQPTGFMIDAVREIRRLGGEAHPESGGWWRSAPNGEGERFLVARTDGGFDSVGVGTMRALAKRGLVAIAGKSAGHSSPVYALTTLADEIVPPEGDTPAP
jgi:hypothetical protein